MEPVISRISGVKETTFIPRDEALKSLVKQLGGGDELMRMLVSRTLFLMQLGQDYIHMK